MGSVTTTINQKQEVAEISRELRDEFRVVIREVKPFHKGRRREVSTEAITMWMENNPVMRADATPYQITPDGAKLVQVILEVSTELDEEFRAHVVKVRGDHYGVMKEVIIEVIKGWIEANAGKVIVQIPEREQAHVKEHVV